MNKLAIFSEFPSTSEKILAHKLSYSLRTQTYFRLSLAVGCHRPEICLRSQGNIHMETRSKGVTLKAIDFHNMKSSASRFLLTKQLYELACSILI